MVFTLDSLKRAMKGRMHFFLFVIRLEVINIIERERGMANLSPLILKEVSMTIETTGQF